MGQRWVLAVYFLLQECTRGFGQWT